MKIDYSKAIEGFEEMSAEEKLQAVMDYEIDTSGYVRKDLFDKTASELSAKKKELRSKLSEDEAKKQEQEDLMNALKAKVETLEHEKKVSEYNSKFVTAGFDSETAQKLAADFSDGNFDSLFNSLAKRDEEIVKRVKTDVLKGTPRPEGGSTGTTMSKEALSKMTTQERLTWSSQHKEEYQAIMEGK